MFTHIVQGCFTGTGAIKWGNQMIAPVPVKQPWKIWVKISSSSHNKTQENTHKVLNSWDAICVLSVAGYSVGL